MSERQLIENIRSLFQNHCSDIVQGIGDDCAVFKQEKNSRWLVSTDMLVENVHFDLSFHPPEKLGRKVVAVNLSDIAAMGGVADFILISLSLPKGIKQDWIDSFISGIHQICSETGTKLIGGDTVRGKVLTVSVTVIGSTGGIAPVYRSGAKVGDKIYVTGNLGHSAAGLRLLNGSIKPSQEGNYQGLLEAHLDPEPQLFIGRALAERSIASAMIDVSDGISTDLAHICAESGVGALVFEQSLPCAEELQKLCTQADLSLPDLMLSGGEDYQLLFTSPLDAIENDPELLKFGGQITRIGEIVPGNGVILQYNSGEKKDVSYTGYEHV